MYILGIPSSKRNYKVNGLGESASRAKFKNDKGQMMTVEQYFANEKRTNLKNKDLPTLWVGARDKKILLPMEFCSVVKDQVVQKKLTENQARNMIRESATSTKVRKQKILDALNNANLNMSNPVREFGFSVARDFEKVTARVLEPPLLDYQRTVMVKKGTWNAMSFMQPATITKWALVCFDKYCQMNTLQTVSNDVRKCINSIINNSLVAIANKL